MPTHVPRTTPALHAGVLAMTAAAASQPLPGPAPRTWPAMTFDSSRGVVLLHGGSLDQNEWYRDTWEWSGGGWTLRSAAGPQYVLSLSALTFDSRRGVGVFIGIGGQLWEWNGTIWTDRHRYDAWGINVGAAFDAARGVSVIHGEDSFHAPTGPATYAWDGTTLSDPNYSGPYRWCHTMAYDEARGRVLLFGGVHGRDYMGDTWTWDGAAWTLAATQGPSPRISALAYDTARAVTVLHGGTDGSGVPLDGTWEWDGALWTQRTIPGPGPGPRSGHGLAFDPARGVAVLVGGTTPAGVSGQTWEYDGSTWTLRHVTCQADCATNTGPGVLDIFDFLCFLNIYESGHEYACDCDTSTGPGVCDIFDFLCFQDAFARGCP